MRTEVVVARGRRRHRAGYIYGPLPPAHPLATKVLVIFGPYDDAAIPIENLAQAGAAPAQLELRFPEIEKARRRPEGQRRVKSRES